MNRLELVVLAMHELGGDEKSLDIEDIAMTSSKLSPSTFAWRKYPGQINLELVGFAVRDAKKRKYGELISGSHSDGWRLTVAGQKLAQELRVNSIEEDGQLEVTPVKPRALEHQRLIKEAERAISTQAFQQWRDFGKCEESEIRKLLKVNAYTSSELLEIKKTRLGKCRGIDRQLDAFLDYVTDYELDH